MLNDPRNDLANAVRELATMTASLILLRLDSADLERLAEVLAQAVRLHLFYRIFTARPSDRFTGAVSHLCVHVESQTLCEGRLNFGDQRTDCELAGFSGLLSGPPKQRRRRRVFPVCRQRRPSFGLFRHTQERQPPSGWPRKSDSGVSASLRP